MSKKIVAIGGGENGRLKSDGTSKKYPYETGPMDIEIINLTGKEHPNFLLIAHSQPLERQEGYFKTMLNIFNKKYGCDCRDLKSNELTDKEKVDELINWADIIYEGGGNTLDMIKLWKETKFDNVLKKAWEQGKVMCGISAGANCWFKACSSDSLKILYGQEQPLIGMECLGFINIFMVPHCDEKGRYESSKEILKDKDLVGILLSNCSALEIVDDKYRLITSDASYHGIEAYGLKIYWKDNKFYEKEINKTEEFKPIKELLKK